jgi:probable rRNA maturation factor
MRSIAVVRVLIGHAKNRTVRGTLFVRNRQSVRRVDVRRLRQAAEILLRELLQQDQFDLGIYLVAAPEMAQLNEAFLQHQGSTDVITFDYAEQTSARARDSRSVISAAIPPLHGEIFICTDDAVRQAKAFRTTWPEEIMRYLIHGVLHLCGYDDRFAAARKRMKTKEERLLRDLSSRCDPRRLQRS